MADQSRYADLMRRALTDQSVRSRLKSDPTTVLREHGVHVPDGATIHVHEPDERTAHLVLPVVRGGRSPDQLSDEELNRVAGGITGPFCSEMTCPGQAGCSS